LPGPSEIDVQSPIFQGAFRACEKYIPGSSTVNSPPRPEQQAQALEYAECMRAHGVLSYPDPPAASSGPLLAPRGAKKPHTLTPPQVSPAIMERADQACRSLRG